MVINSAIVASEGTVKTSVRRTDVMGSMKRLSRWPRRSAAWWEETLARPATSCATAAATSAGTTNEDPWLDSATNMTAAIGAR